jgi:hypothetical protein
MMEHDRPFTVCMLHGAWQELDKAGIQAMVKAYRHAARCAMDAGFDGVELHGGSKWTGCSIAKSAGFVALLCRSGRSSQKASSAGRQNLINVAFLLFLLLLLLLLIVSQT